MDTAYYINAMINIWRLKGHSVKTVHNYRGHLERYLNHFNVYPETIAREQRWNYFLALKSASHRNQAMAVVRSLHLHILKSPIDWTELPYTKKEKSLPHYFTHDEVKQLLNAITNPKQKCFIAIQYLCGLRVQEVLNLKLTDISTKEKVIRVNGKGSKQRDINLPDAAIPYLKSYWHWIQPKPSVYLFQGQYGGQYSAKSIQLVLTRAKEKTGLQHRKCSTHGLRHAAATYRINKLGWNTRQTQRFLGHSSIKTTERYTHVNVEDMKLLNQPVL